MKISKLRIQLFSLIKQVIESYQGFSVIKHLINIFNVDWGFYELNTLLK
jgi:hypothetical protein